MLAFALRIIVVFTLHTICSLQGHINMSVEAKLDVLLSIDDTNIPDHIHMRARHLARLLDDVHSIDDIKFLLLAQVINLDRSVSALESNALHINNSIKTLLKAIKS